MLSDASEQRSGNNNELSTLKKNAQRLFCCASDCQKASVVTLDAIAMFM